MERMMIVAKLKAQKHDEAEALLDNGPPYDPEQLGFIRHSAYMTASEVIFLFEWPEVEWIVGSFVNDPVASTALAPWRALVDGQPRIAHEHYFWEPERGVTT
jgi:hypothetical protein